MARSRDEAAFAARKGEILRAAEALFVEQGFHQTGMAAICAAAGMSPGALYRYFPSKAEIIRGIVEEEQAESAGWFDRLESARNFPRALVDALEQAIESVGGQAYGRLALEIAAEGARDPEIAAILAAADSQAHERLTSIIAAAQKRGQVDQSTDARASARLLIMLIDGATGAVASGLPKRRLRPLLRRLVDGLFVDSAQGLEAEG